MKLLQFLEDYLSSRTFNCLVFKGDCPFQKEILRMAIFKKLSQLHKISSQWISISEQGVDTICQSFEQPSLFAKPTFYILDECYGISSKQQQNLISTCLKASNPMFFRIIYLTKIDQKNLIPADQLIESQPKKPGYLAELTMQAMKIMDLPVNKYLADQISEIHPQNPIQILSELQKLRLFLEPGQDNYIIQDVLPLFPQSKQVSFFGFLDGIATRRLQRSLREIQSLKDSSQWEPNKLLIATKSHFRKLLDLKNWTYNPDELRLFQQSHKYLTSRSRKEKENIATDLRRYYENRLNSEQYEKFQKQFKSDYYFSKLVFQQHYFTHKELSKLLTDCSHLLSIFQQKHSSEEFSLHQFVFDSCHK